jgi:hypothetical protein
MDTDPFTVDVKASADSVTEETWRELHALAGEPHPGRFKGYASHFLLMPTDAGRLATVTARLRELRLPHEVEACTTWTPTDEPDTTIDLRDRDRATEHADGLAYELGQATGLDVGRVHVGGGCEQLEAHIPDGREHGDVPPAVHHVIISRLNEPAVPTDEHGNFPHGVAVTGRDENGENSHPGALFLLAVDPAEAATRGTDGVKQLIVKALNGWRISRAVAAAYRLADDLTARTGLTCVPEFTMAGTGAIMVRAPGAPEGDRYLQVTVPGDAFVPVDGNGRFPSGLVACEYTGDEQPYPDEDTPPVIELSPEQCEDPSAAVDDLVAQLRAWGSMQRVRLWLTPVEPEPAQQPASSVALGATWPWRGSGPTRTARGSCTRRTWTATSSRAATSRSCTTRRSSPPSSRWPPTPPAAAGRRASPPR